MKNAEGTAVKSETKSWVFKACQHAELHEFCLRWDFKVKELNWHKRLCWTRLVLV